MNSLANWKKEYRQNVHFIILLGLIGMILYGIYRDISPYKFWGFFIIVIYSITIFLDLKKEKYFSKKLLTILLLGFAVFLSIFISLFIFSPYPVSLITFILIQGFIWVSSCLLLEKESKYSNKSSVKALELLYNDYSNTAKHYITVGILLMGGIGAGVGVELFSKNSLIGLELASLIAISSSYFTVLLCYSILFPINKIKDEIIDKINKIDVI